LYVAIYGLLENERPVNQVDGYTRIVHADTWAAWNAGGAPDAVCKTDTDAGTQAKHNEALKEVFKNKEVSNQIALDLLVASSAKELTAQNYKSYCEMKGGVHPSYSAIKGILKWAGARFCGLMGDDDVRGKLTKCDWVKYHTAFGSAGSLCSRIFDMIPEGCTHIVSIADRAAATSSAEAPWDRDLMGAISDKGLAFTEIAVRGLELNVGVFYSGKRAVSNISPITVKQYEELVKQMVKKDPSISKMKSAKTIDEVFVSLPSAERMMKDIVAVDVVRRRELALSAINRSAVVKAKKRAAEDAGTPFMHTMDTISKGALDAVDEEDY
jgi:hypothetical protein